MDADEARRAGALLRAAGVAGIIAPVAADDPAGEWRVYDSDDPGSRTDTTARALAAAVEVFNGPPPAFAPARLSVPWAGEPARGFILPPGNGS